MYGCKLAMGKSYEHTKLSLSSLTRKFVCYYTFYIAVEEKETKYETLVDRVSWTKRNII